MIDPELAARLDAIEAKAEAARVASEQVRRYLIWTGIITAAIIILPVIGLAFAIPAFVANYIDPINAATGNASIQDTLNLLGL